MKYELSGRARHAVENNLLTKDRVRSLKDKDLLRMTNLGRVTLAELRNWAAVGDEPQLALKTPKVNGEAHPFVGRRTTVEIGNAEARAILRQHVGAPIDAAISIRDGKTILSWSAK